MEQGVSMHRMKILDKTGLIKTKPAPSGFTIIELLVVVAMIGILSAIGIPTYLQWSHDAKMTDAVNTVRADLELSKISAIKHRSFVVILYNSQRYTIFVDNGDGGGSSGDWARNGSELLIISRDLPPGVTIDLGVTTLASNRLRFNSMGLPDIFSAETIGIDSPGRQEQVTINRVGRIRII